MDKQSDTADEGEEGKTNRDDMADQLIGYQHHVFPGDERIEFALAVLPFPELVWQLADRNGRGDEARISRRILKPWPESRRRAPSRTSRRSMKKPLIGSAISALQISRDRRVAKALIFARPESHPPIPPPTIYRLPTTRSTGSSFSIASICGSSFSSCCMSASITAI